MTPSHRIRLARRHAGLSQAGLAAQIGVQRSAVSHWETGKQPTVKNLREVALTTGVQFEWLATGRGAMALSDEMRLDSILAVDALWIDDPMETLLIERIRTMAPVARVALMDIAEHLAQRRVRRGRS